jgi:hypothetical protein
VSTKTLFLLSIWGVGLEFIDAIDSIYQLSLGIHWQFQGLQLLCFHRRFMDQLWHSVFDNSMRQPWLYFCYRFDVLVMNSVTLSIPYISCHPVFIDNFKFKRDTVFVDDLWISSDIMFLTIPYVNHNSIFAIGLIRIHWRCQFHMSAITQYSLMIIKVYSCSVFAGDLWISCDIAFLTIPCISHDFLFAIDSMRRSWIHWRCRLHTSTVTQNSLTISWSIVTLFLPPICGSALT